MYLQRRLETDGYVALAPPPRGKIQVSLQRMRKAVRETHNHDRLVHTTEADTLCVSSLYVKNRCYSWKPESRRYQTDRVWQGFRFTSKVRALQWVLKRAFKWRGHPRRLPSMPKNSSVPHQKALTPSVVSVLLTFNSVSFCRTPEYCSFYHQYSQA